jgi:Amt family ammonium transporter
MDAKFAADSVWVLVATALVLLMTPALGLFYGGLVRRKNVLSTLMYSFFTVSLISIQWVLLGYSISFGESVNGLIGDFAHMGLTGVGLEVPAEGGIPPMLFMAFQMTFAIITPALISGSFVERKRFGAFVLFTLLWATVVYNPVAHWVWADGGWLAQEGALDFAGGTVVHITAGVSALVCALVIGRRRGFGTEQMEPHNATMTVLGASLLWFGWFGFNAGSALAIDGVAVNALVTTNTAAAAAAITWLLLAWSNQRKVTVIGAAVGAVAGLVGITPAAGFVSPTGALAIGVITSACCYYVTEFVVRGRVDDSLDVFGVHGVGGIVGAILTGVFATPALTDGAGGLLHGNFGQLVVQVKAVLAVGVYAAIATFVILKAVNVILPIRVSESEENAGLDLSQHGEVAYTAA